MSLVLVIGVVKAQAQPTFSKAFISDTIGPGSVSTLTFTIINSHDVPVTDLAFTDNLPADLVIASPANAHSTCGGILSAPAGGSVITFSGGTIGSGATGLIVVNVTCVTPGTYHNVSGDLTSSAGNSGPAEASLIVATDRPGFSKSFTPSTLARGSRSTLTFTIDNSANSSLVQSLNFIDNLPVGIKVASPANMHSTITGGVVTAVPGSSIVALSGSNFLTAGTTGTVSVDVVASSAGDLGNISGDLICRSGPSLFSCGKASALLAVASDSLSLMKSFTQDPVSPGGMVTLEFTITNADRDLATADISFSDDLAAVLSGLVATGLPQSDVCGPGSILSGSNGNTLITLSGGNLGPAESATFSVALQVPAGVDYAPYFNTTSTISGTVAGEEVTGSPASDTLFVVPQLLFSKEFTDDPVGAGGQVTLEFTITNPFSDTASNISFTDDLVDILPSAASLPSSGFLGPGSSMVFVPAYDIYPSRIMVSGGSLGPLDSETFSVVFDVAVNATSGFYPNTTSPISVDYGEVSFAGPPAQDILEVVGGARLVKSFTDDPVDPGSTVTLEFTLTNTDNINSVAGISFTDDLTAVMAGLNAVGLPLDDVCGPGSQLSGTTILTLTGGNLDPGASATFSVQLQVPGDALSGSYPNETSNVSAMVDGFAVESRPAADDLKISGLTLAKEFIDDPVIPGETVTLRFSLRNPATNSEATLISFNDDLGEVLSGLTATNLPLDDVCGAGSLLSAVGEVLMFQNGTLAPGATKQFDVLLQVPVDAPSGIYRNRTEKFAALIGGTPVAPENAVDDLEVNSYLIDLGKTFIDDPVVPGGFVILEFTLTNLDNDRNLTGISFTDDLEAMLPGLVATGLPAHDVCGSGSLLSGTSSITLTAGSLPAGGAATFQVLLAVPAGAAAGTYSNVSSLVDGQIAGFAVCGAPAVADLRLQGIAFSKHFDGEIEVGGDVLITFTIENLDTVNGIENLAFVDDLGAMIPGLVATGLPLSDVCGPGSQLSGTSVLTLAGGSLAPGASSSFSVSLQVPVTAEPGTYFNSTSDLSSGGIMVASPATANLVVSESDQIPTLSEWGLVVIIMVLSGASLLVLRRRRLSEF